MDYQDEQKVIIPSPKELEQIDEIDKTKVFWTIVLAVFIVGFVFMLGYWVGQQQAKANDFSSLSPGNSIDLSNLGTPVATSSSPVSQQPQEAPYEGDNLGALDGSLSNSDQKAPSSTMGHNSPILPPQEMKQPPLDSPSPVSPPMTQNSVPPIKIIPQPVSKHHQASKLKAKGNWALRLASVRSEKNAYALKRKLSQMGYDNVNVLKIGVLYRVSVLGFKDQNQVKEFQNKVERQFHLTDTMIIKL